jgi:hypothetical protein
MTQQMNEFLRSFIGYGEDQITNLNIEWETDGAGPDPEAVAGSPVLVYQTPGGDMKSKPMTEDACLRCREALMADLQQLVS